MENIALPNKIQFTEETDRKAVVVMEPCYPGYGTTLGNALRRVLLSSLPGAAVTAIKIRGVDHEFSTIPNVKEDVVEIILNMKQLRLRVFSEEPIRLRLHVKGEKEATGANIEKHDLVEIVNPDLKIATLDNKNAEFDMEIIVQQGRGYVPVEMREHERHEIGMIAVDAVYTPIQNVHFDVENVRVGQLTNYDKLTLTMETDGTISGRDALDIASRILIDHFSLFLKTPLVQPQASPESASPAAPQSREDDIELLHLPARAANSLRKAGINTIWNLRSLSAEELAKVEGLGEKSIRDIQKALEEYNG
jgi:DNA-directed RNA polymerase subunit alpha